MAQKAGLYLRVIDPGRTRPPEERAEATVQGTQDWMRYETTIDVPADSVFVLFGISLTGPGQVWVTNVQLDAERERARPRASQPASGGGWP